MAGAQLRPTNVALLSWAVLVAYRPTRALCGDYFQNFLILETKLRVLHIQIMCSTTCNIFNNTKKQFEKPDSKMERHMPCYMQLTQVQFPAPHIVPKYWARVIPELRGRNQAWALPNVSQFTLVFSNHKGQHSSISILGLIQDVSVATSHSRLLDWIGDAHV